MQHAATDILGWLDVLRSSRACMLACPPKINYLGKSQLQALLTAAAVHECRWSSLHDSDLLADSLCCRFVMATPQPGCVAATNELLHFYDASAPVGNMVGWLVLYLAVMHIATYLALANAARRGTGKRQ